MIAISRLFSVLLVKVSTISLTDFVFDGSIFWHIFGLAKNASAGPMGNPDRANSEGPAPPRSMAKAMLR